MNEDERRLWERTRQGDEAAQEALVLRYLDLVKDWAKRISRIADWANPEDLMQDGIFGLMDAIDRFDLERGVEFKYYAFKFIRGAMFQGSELTRNLAQQQAKIYREVKRADAELTQAQRRIPTIEEVAEKTGYNVEQIENAIEAMSLAFAGEFPDLDLGSPPALAQAASQERALTLRHALTLLSQRKQTIIHLYYWQDQSPAEIAQKLGLKESNVTKIRQRAIADLRKLLGVKKKGKHNGKQRPEK